MKVLKGFALLEVLIAMVIIGVGLMSLAKFQSNIMRSNMLAKERTKAVIFAQAGIETYRNSVIGLTDNSKLGNAGTTTDLNNSNPYRTTEFTRTQQIRTLGNGDIEIAMTVTWPDLNASDGAATGETTTSLTSVISRQAINDSAAKLMLHPSVNFTCFSGLSPNVDGMC